LKMVDRELKELYNRVAESLVAILSLKEGSCNNVRDLTTQLLNISTGFAIRKNIVVATLHSVESASTVCVMDSIQDMVFEARVEGRDNRWDVALLRVEGLSKTPLKLSMSSAEVGSIVVALGCAYGYGMPAVVLGVISSMGRRIAIGGRDVEGLMMVEAHSYGGMSGAPLIDVEEEVIGMVIAQEAKLGTMFAVPSKWIAYDLEMLEKRGFVASPRLGISMALARLGPQLFKPVITRVDPDSEAHRCGLQEGDVIVSVGGKEIYTIEDLWEEMYRAAIENKDLKIVVLRGSRYVENVCRVLT